MTLSEAVGDVRRGGRVESICEDRTWWSLSAFRFKEDLAQVGEIEAGSYAIIASQMGWTGCWLFKSSKPSGSKQGSG